MGKEIESLLDTDRTSHCSALETQSVYSHNHLNLPEISKQNAVNFLHRSLKKSVFAGKQLSHPAYFYSRHSLFWHQCLPLERPFLLHQVLQPYSLRAFPMCSSDMFQAASWNAHHFPFFLSPLAPYFWSQLPEILFYLMASYINEELTFMHYPDHVHPLYSLASLHTRPILSQLRPSFLPAYHHSPASRRNWVSVPPPLGTGPVASETRRNRIPKPSAQEGWGKGVAQVWGTEL